MGMWIGRNRKARVTYGFDEIALVPGDVTINPNEVDTTFSIPRKDGSAIDAENPHHRQRHGRRDRCAVLHRDGQARRPGRDQPGRRADPLRQSRRKSWAKSSRRARRRSRTLIQKFYAEPIKEELICRADRGIEEGRRAGRRQFHSAKGGALRRHRPGGRAPTFSSCNPPFPPSNIIPPNINRWSWPIFAGRCSIPVIIGNAVTYNVTLQLMGCGVARGFDRRRAGRGLHQPRRARAWASRRSRPRWIAPRRAIIITS